MNILQLVPKLEVGGVERGTVDFAKYLTLHGHKAVVVSGGGQMDRQLDDMGARHYRLPVGLKNPFTVLFAIPKVVSIINKENIDIVHARSRVPAIIGYCAAKLTKRTFVTTAHGYYSRYIFSRVMSWGRLVIVASRDMAAHMKDDFGTPHERIRLIPRGVDLSDFTFRDPAARPPAPQGAEIVIGIVARITPLKGHLDFIRAVSLVYREVPYINVLVIGEAPRSKRRYKEDVETLIKRLGLSDVVTMMGARRDIPELLSKMDMLVLPTTTPEAFGRVIIEAQARGVPVVATSVGGITDIIRDGENGLLCPPADPRSLSAAMMRIIKDRTLAEALVRAARKDVEERFSLQRMAEETLAVYGEALRQKKILVIKISAVGDVILSVPSLRAIRKKFPDAVITLLVSSHAAQALRGCPYVDRKLVYDPKGRDSGVRGFLSAVSSVRKDEPDIVVDLQNNRGSHLLAYMSMAPERYGYDNGKFSFLLSHKVKGAGAAVDPVEHQFRTLQMIGIREADKRLELWTSPEDEEWADAFLRDNWIDEKRVIVGMNVGASPRWETKVWHEESFAGLCDTLAKKHHVRVVLTGTADDRKRGERIASLSKSKPVLAAGKTSLLRLAALIKRCRVYLTSDSAPMHIAAGVETPFVGLFGPTDPARHTPETGKCTIIKSGIECVPCYKPKCTHERNCMDKISIEEVLSAVEKYLR